MSDTIVVHLERRSRPAFETAISPELPREDDVSMVSPEEAAEFYDECLAGHTLMIEYRDATGATSRRAVTIRSFAPGTPGYMRAVCHERHAFRSFRLDRITSVIDRYGEVFEPAESYFIHRFGLVGFGLFSPGMETEAEFNKRILNIVRPGLLCLSALAGADRFLHVEEVEALLQFCDHRCDAAGIRLDDSHVDMLSRHIERFLVPDAKALTNAAIQLAGSSALPLFYRYARQVLEADGDIDLAESEMYLAIRAVIDAATTSSESTF